MALLSRTHHSAAAVFLNGPQHTDNPTADDAIAISRPGVAYADIEAALDGWQTWAMITDDDTVNYAGIRRCTRAGLLQPAASPTPTRAGGGQPGGRTSPPKATSSPPNSTSPPTFHPHPGRPSPRSPTSSTRAPNPTTSSTTSPNPPRAVSSAKPWPIHDNPATPNPALPASISPRRVPLPNRRHR